MTPLRFLAVFGNACALVAIIYVALSGERWPLGFVATLVGGDLVLGAAELLHREDD